MKKEYLEKVRKSLLRADDILMQMGVVGDENAIKLLNVREILNAGADVLQRVMNQK